VECYIVRYQDFLDFEEASNQWFRSTTKAMTADELQKAVDSHLKIVGSGEKFRTTVAKEGMIRDSNNATTYKAKEKNNDKEKVTRIFGSKNFPLKLLKLRVFRIIFSELKRT
jgi:hypothetical protein